MITVTRQPSARKAIEAIPEDAWVDIAYTLGGRAQVAETTYTTSPKSRGKDRAVRARLAAAVLAHNLKRWTLALADQPAATNRTLRTRLIALAAVLVNACQRDGHGPRASSPA